MHGLYKQSLSAALVAALAFGCGSGDKQQQQARAPSGESSAMPPSSTTTTTGAEQGAYGQEQQGAMTGSAEPQEPSAGGAAEPSSTTTITQGTMEKTTSLSDGEVFAIESALNNGAVKLAELAKKKASNRQVKDYAASMVTDHRDAQNKAKDIARKNNITAKEDDASKKLKSEVSSTETTLKDKKGNEFDTAFMDSQVKMHKDGLETIDNQLLPSVKNAAMKDHLTTFRGSISEHLTKAQDIQSRLQAVGTTSTTGATSEPGKTKATGGAEKGKTEPPKSKPK